MAVTFTSRQPPGCEPLIDVSRGGRLLGQIRRSPLSGLNRYYPESFSNLDAILENDDLDALMATVTQHLQPPL